MKKLLTLLASSFLAISSAHALLITPATTHWAVATNSSLNAAEVQAIVGSGLLSLAYKQNVGGGEEGTFASSYNTTFSNGNADAFIDYISGMTFLGSLYLVVKDGNNTPAQYIFDITSWNRTEDLFLQGFWPLQGEISHIAIFSGPGVPTQFSVPEGGQTLVLLALAAVCIATLRLRSPKAT